MPRLSLLGNDIEIINLSDKNSIIVQGESVQKWKLVNSGTFILGDTEFQIQFDLGQSVVPIKPAPNFKEIAKAAELALAPQKKSVSLAAKKQLPDRQVQQKQAQHLQAPPKHLQQKQPQQQQSPSFQSISAAPLNKATGSKIRFYIIIVALIGIGYYFFGMQPKNTKKTDEKKTVLKYSDEVQIKLNSKSEKENQKKIEKLYELKNSPTALRAQENFIKGMRDFQLGNYTRAQEFFQVVLNLQPGHELAKRHLYLSTVRFDEVLKAKLMLGESYYQKHNFKMCQSMYEQVLNMLQGKSSDQNYQIAAAMVDKCRLASEGVR
jgi:tetratricopeptide (TPR) repeat protein